VTDIISPWKPEPNLLIHQALGKACEEASELANILARCLIQGLDQCEPVSGKPNRQALSEEIADVDAAVQWLRELTGVEYDEARADRKLNGLRRWQKLIEGGVAPISRADWARKIEGVLNIPSAGHASAGELADTILDALGVVEGSNHG
jgi:hypothetical protein